MNASSVKIIAASLLLCCSCEGFFDTKEQGVLKIFFPDEFNLYTKVGTIPEPNDFQICVTGPDGNTVYNGNYGNTPDELFLDPGSYTVSARSCEFNEPVFDRPQYGDNQVVKISSGKTTTVNLSCYQLNCGIQLKIDPSFPSVYPDGVLFLKSAEGKLLYSFSEKRTAFFKPGTVSLIMSSSGKDVTLLSRTLQAQQMLALSLSVSGETKPGAGSGISISVDTSHTWISDSYILGGDGKGSEMSNAYTVSQAKTHIGESDVWVQGYIVGGDLSSSRCSFNSPFQSRTNIVIASKSSCTTKESCLSVQLSKGDIRDALNLVDNQGNLKKGIYIKGDIVEAYYGIPGIQSITEWAWKE